MNLENRKFNQLMNKGKFRDLFEIFFDSFLQEHFSVNVASYIYKVYQCPLLQERFFEVFAEIIDPPCTP